MKIKLIPITFVICAPMVAIASKATEGDIQSVYAKEVEFLQPYTQQDQYIHLAQVGNGGFGGDPGSDPDAEPDRGPEDENTKLTIQSVPVTVGKATTKNVVLAISTGGETCAQIQREYLVDCLAATYRRAAGKMPRIGDYAEARKIMLETANKLERVVRANQDREKPNIKISAQTPQGEFSVERIRPVRAASIEQVNASALRIVAEAETLLLRSSENTVTRSIHYQQIASAIGSNKVLLRSV